MVAVGKILIINNVYDSYYSYWRITGWDVPLNFSAIPTELRMLISLKAELLRVPGEAPANRLWSVLLACRQNEAAVYLSDKKATCW